MGWPRQWPHRDSDASSVGRPGEGGHAGDVHHGHAVGAVELRGDEPPSPALLDDVSDALAVRAERGHAVAERVHFEVARGAVAGVVEQQLRAPVHEHVSPIRRPDVVERGVSGDLVGFVVIDIDGEEPKPQAGPLRGDERQGLRGRRPERVVRCAVGDETDGARLRPVDLPLRRGLGVEQHQAGDRVSADTRRSRYGGEPAVGRPGGPGVADVLRLLRAVRDADAGLAGRAAAANNALGSAAVASDRPDVEARADEDDALGAGGFGGGGWGLVAAARRQDK